MKTFVWNDCFVTGIAKVDEQHLRLVELINGLSDWLSGNRNLEMAKLDKLIDELADYTQYHFSEEEAYMAGMGCDITFQKEHIRQHADFINNISLLHKDAHYAPERFADSAVHYLVSWLAYHILGVDQSMARQIKRIQNGATPEQAFREDQQVDNQTVAVLLDALVRLSDVSAGRAIGLGEANEQLLQAKLELERRVEEKSREMAQLVGAVQARMDAFARLDPDKQLAGLEALRADISDILGKASAKP